MTTDDGDKPGQGVSRYNRDRLPDDDTIKQNSGCRISTLLARHVNLACEADDAKSKSHWLEQAIELAVAKSLQVPVESLRITPARLNAPAAKAAAELARLKYEAAEEDRAREARAKRMAELEEQARGGARARR